MKDNPLADRVRSVLAGQDGISEKPMFGGICFMLNGNMLAGASTARGLLVRIGRDAYAAALASPHTRPMESRGRPYAGYVYVDAEGTQRDRDLKSWVDRALAHVATLPAKPAAPARKPARKA
jgi:TfoX/Sxy family transcriptional regulator of competence genes